MNLKYFYIATAIIVAFLLFLAIGYDGWGCGGSAFSDGCDKWEKMKKVGALLLTAGLLILLVALFIGLQFSSYGRGMSIAALIFVIISTVLSVAGVFYYYDKTSIWSPFIATMGMTVSIVLTVLLIYDFIHGPRY